MAFFSKPTYRVSKQGLRKMQMERFKLFKLQDLENGFFDVTFEIEGKKLLAHRFTIAAVSETFRSMLSDRWSTKDEPVKIESYCYDNFSELLRFLYSGNCRITNQNVFQLVDIAEFYAVPSLKAMCEWFLFSMIITVENVDELFETSQKYSLTRLTATLEEFVQSNIGAIIEAKKFVSSKKSFIQFLSGFGRISRTKNFFLAVYKWAEQQVMEQQPIDDGNFNLQEAIKAEFLTVFPHPPYPKMNIHFLISFVAEKGFCLSPLELQTLYKRNENYNDEYSLELVYDVAKKQVRYKQKLTPVDNFNLTEAIKAEMVEVFPIVEFGHFEDFFLEDFVLAKGIITKKQANHVFDTRVRITNNGKSVSGAFKDKIGILRAYWRKKHFYNIRRRSTTKIRFTQEHFNIPSNQKSITKMRGVTWYLCIEEGNILTFKHHTLVKPNDFLLAEMKGDPDFQLVPSEMTHLVANYNNLESV